MTKRKPISIRVWSVAYGLDEIYAAPELRGISLIGRLPNGLVVKTSRIVKVSRDGRTVETETGGYYHAEGPPAPAYIDWLAEHELPFDPKRPIKLRVG